MITKCWVVLVAAFTCFLVASAQQIPAGMGIFERNTDVGENPKSGNVQYDPATREYRVTGGGANIWSTVDAFHYAWKQVSGDFALTADVRFVGEGAVAHRKAVLMVRQSLDPAAAYADVALHGDGLTALQYRPAAGGDTQEVRSSETGPVHLRIERRGNQFTMYAGKPDGKLVASEPVTLKLEDPIYVGIGVCSHDANILETAIFSNVSIEKLAPKAQ
jgi:TolB protein